MKERERKKIGFLLGIFVLLCFIFMIGFQYDKSYKITGREDIVKALNSMHDGDSYTEKDIYTYHKSKDRIDLLYKNNTYKDYYVFCILKKNKYFKDRYEVLFEKKIFIKMPNVICSILPIRINPILCYMD
ncbi:MAG: hypothetical protein Q4Q07_02890 [Tissierellia bacterium]|nr:hypothetical protein [Tissierellia bacterium]